MMVRLFFESLSRYLRGWISAFSPSARRVAPLNFRRLLWLLAGFPLFLAFQLVHWLGFLADELLFRRYRHVRIDRPLFITGIPRSGTTFVHRSLADDAGAFVTMRTWEAVLAPSILERRVWKAVAGLDRRWGGRGRRIVERLLARAEGDFADVHAVALDAPEEDYLCLLPAAGCFLAVLAFPLSATFWKLGRLDQWPCASRRRLLEFYRRSLQKQLHEEGRGRRLLIKNAAFASWIPSLRETFPDARFLVCVRDPESALSSQLSAVAGAFEALGGGSVEGVMRPPFVRTFEHAYGRLAAEAEAARRDVAFIDQAELQSDPEAVLRRALGILGEACSPRMAAAVRTGRGFRSRHRHAPAFYGLSPETIGTSLSASYASLQAVARNPHPSRPETPSLPERK